MPKKLTKEIIEDDVLWRKYLWGELYEAVKPILEEYEAIHDDLIINGTGESEPVGILRIQPKKD